MPGRRSGAIVFTALITVVFAVAVILALGYSSRARMAPLVIAIPGFVLAAGRLVIEIRLAGAQKGKGLEGTPNSGERAGQDGEAVSEAAPNDNPGPHSEINILLWLALMMAMLFLLGFLVTIPIYLLLYLRVRSREGWPMSVVVSLSSWAVLYFLFVKVLGMTLYTGFLVELLL